MLTVNEVAQRQEHEARGCQCNTGVVESTATFHADGLFILSESTESGPSAVSSGTGLAPWGVARANAEISVVFDALEFARVNVATVISAGCGCRPGHNSGFSGFDGEGVFGFDAVHSIPANGGGNEWVHYSDALIEDQNLRPSEEEPSEACCGRNQAHLKNPASIAKEKDLNSKQDIQQENHTGRYEGGCWSESLEIGHQTILPSTAKFSSLEGK